MIIAFYLQGLTSTTHLWNLSCTTYGERKRYVKTTVAGARGGTIVGTRFRGGKCCWMADTKGCNHRRDIHHMLALEYWNRFSLLVQAQHVQPVSDLYQNTN